MSNNIQNLQPTQVWKHFYALTQIPRPSGHSVDITAFIENFGKQLGLETLRDSAGNICIRKPATPGYENRPTVILQSHLDMVPQNNSDTPFDFTKDKIEAYIDGDWVKARGTTLGADNGIGVATTMAILEAKDLQHGPIEGLFTTDEETGMYGALAVRPGFINGKIMLNLDSELDGELYIGCAGGADVTARFQYQEETWIPKEDMAMKVSLTGLKGGHSGVDIHLGRANANKLLFRFLKEAAADYDIRLSSVSGGSLRNAIPREAFAVIIIDGKEKYKQVLELISAYESLFNQEFAEIENPISFKAERIDMTPDLKLIPKEVQHRLIHAINACPNNVINYFAALPDTVETSINMAIIQSSEGLTEVKFLARSSSESKKNAICSAIESVFALAKADFVETSNGYPGWDPNPKSQVLKVMEKVFEQQRGHKPEVKVMHAGLECGIILASVLGLDTVSFGPTIKFPHSPDEKTEIATVQKFWDYLTAILVEI
ncbi:aminoacyl-histidine dipeptidase [Bacteroidia bacterium]|nr:aminoacyl-histidine dipeptidase [Bacteroidia bacterium]GHU67963.1 aminoacyl-histidine dipeptidase [Bacteroidia bacterium]